MKNIVFVGNSIFFEETFKFKKVFEKVQSECNEKYINKL